MSELHEKVEHAEAEMCRGKGMSYCGRSWKGTFICPICGRRIWQNLNFLGRRKIYCSGTKIRKQAGELERIMKGEIFL